MQSQISRESQGASFQTGSDSAREGSGAAGMQSGLIRGDYRYLNQIGSRSRGASDSSASGAQARQERLIELHLRAQAQRGRMTEEEIHRHIEEGWKGKDFENEGISGDNFTENHITACIEKKWRARDFKHAGVPANRFTNRHIAFFIREGWSSQRFSSLGFKSENFSKSNICLCLKNGWEVEDFVRLEFSSQDFSEKAIYLCLTKDWTKENFERLGINVEEFTEKIITACIQSDWGGWRFKNIGIPGKNFTKKHINLCIEKEWRGEDFQVVGVSAESFTEEHIFSCLRIGGWRGKDFKHVGISSVRLKEIGITVDVLARQYGWQRKDFSAITFPKEEFGHFSVFEQSYLCPREMLQDTDSKLPSAEEYNKSYQELYQSRKDTTSRLDWNIPEVKEQEDLEADKGKITSLSQELEEQLKTKLVESRPGLGADLLYNYTMHVDPNEATLLFCIKDIVDRIVKDYLSNDNASDIISNLIKLCNSVRTYINEKDRDKKKRKKADIIQACEAFLTLLEKESDLHDIISFVKELEGTFDEDDAFELKPSGEIDDYKIINPGDKEQHNALFQQNIFNRHQTMKKALNWDEELGQSQVAYTFNSPCYNSWLQTFLKPEKSELRKPGALKYKRLRNMGLYQMSCMCGRIEQNIKLYRYIEYHRDPLLQICGYQTRGNTLPKEEIIERLAEAKKANIQLEDPAFMSTGFVPVPSYAREVMIVICCPAGTPMYITNFANEYKEVVLPRHTKLKILEVEDVKGDSEYGDACQIVLTVEVTGVGM